MIGKGKQARVVHKSFAFKIITALSLCVLTVSGAFSTVFINTQINFYEEMLMKNGSLLADVLAHNVRLGVFSDNKLMIESPVEGIMSQKGVVGVVVYDMFGNIILEQEHVQKKEAAETSGDRGPQVDEILEGFGVNKESLCVYAGGMFEFWAAVVTNQTPMRMPQLNFERMESEGYETVIGAVKVTVKNNVMDEYLRSMILKIAVIGTASLFAGICMAYLLVSGITRPLRLLAREVSLLGVKDSAGRIRVRLNRDDEIGRLATAFNIMASNLEKERMLQEELQRELEKRVADRTAEIQGINEQLVEQIRERMAVHQALRDRDQLYRGVFESSADAFIICDEEYRVVDVNGSATTIYDYPYEEFKQLSLSDLMHSDHCFFVHREYKEIMESDGLFFTEALGLKRGRKEIHVAVSVVKYIYEGKKLILVTFRNITDTKALQEKLIRSERLVATGKLASSVAHEVNSPLQGITSLLSVMRKSCEGNKEMLGDIDLLKGAFVSIRNTVKKLMDLNRSVDERKQAVDIHAIIRNTTELVRGYLWKNKVAVQLDFCPHAPAMAVSTQKMGQCFMNLVNNAVEAMGGSEDAQGIHSMKEISARKIMVRTTIREGRFLIEFEDTGPGIAEEDLSHLFEPFYTRRKSHGIGVGLAICQEAVEHHNGTITASNGSHGALFTIELPLTLGT